MEGKRLRLDLQDVLGLGDAFGEGFEAGPFSFTDLFNLDKKLGSLTDEEVEALSKRSLECAKAVGMCIDVFTRVNEEDKAQNFGELLVSDLQVNSYSKESNAFIEMGLWQKVQRFSRSALKKARRNAADSFGQETAISFKELYMGKLTEYFGGDLDKLRTATDMNDDPFDENVMEVMVETLQSGIDVFTEDERNALMVQQNDL